jgi:N4-gp56 family major capsid protein
MFFNQVSGYTLETRAKYYGFNALTAPSTNRKIFVDNAGVGGYTGDESLGVNDTFTLKWIDYAREKAETSDPMIRPLMMGGEKKYVLYLHPYQITDLRTNTSTGQWLDLQKAAMMGGKVTNNPIYTGALGEYNNVVIRKSFDVKAGISNAAGTAVTTVRRAVLLGAQAAAIGFGRDSGPTDYSWVEKTFDYDRELGISVQTILGLTKCVFNSNDFGAMTISSYAAAHA